MRVLFAYYVSYRDEAAASEEDGSAAMIYLFVILLLVVIFLFVNSARQTSIRWIVLTLLMACAGILSFALSTLSPSADAHGRSAQLYEFLEDTGRGLLFLCGLAPYAVLMFAIAYTDRLSAGKTKTLAIVLPLPIMALDLLHPISNLAINDTLLLVIQNLYTLISAAILVFRTAKERNPKKRKERAITSLALVPPILFGNLFCFLALIVDPTSESNERYLNYSAYAAAAVFVGIFLILVFRYGIFGIRIVLHRQLLDQTVKGIAYGTIMMNHAIKNHATNIQLLTHGLKNGTEPIRSDGDLDMVIAESQQIMEMVRRIQSQIEDIAITREPCDLTQLIEQALATQRHRADGRSIEIVKQWSEDVVANCDKIHMQEAFYNIVQSAFDAIGETAGVVHVRIERTRKTARVEVTDSGAGIAKSDLEKIIDSFFSTKPGGNHFGLGLSYCYFVVQRHGGTIEAVSQKGQGTTVTVTLPLLRKQAKRNVAHASFRDEAAYAIED